MSTLIQTSVRRGIARAKALRRFSQPAILFSLLLLFPVAALAQSGSPFDTGFTALQNLFTGTVAKVASLIAIVISVASGATAVRSWLRTRDESAGSGHHLVDAGEGRTRFLAMFGILTSLLFLIATLFATAVIFLVPLCT